MRLDLLHKVECVCVVCLTRGELGGDNETPKLNTSRIVEKSLGQKHL